MSKRTTQPKAPAETTPASGDVNAPVVQYKFSDGSTMDLPMSEVKARRDAQVAKMIESDDAELHFEGLRARDRYALLDRAMQEEHEAKLLQRETEQAAADAAKAAKSAERKKSQAERAARKAEAEVAARNAADEERRRAASARNSKNSKGKHQMPRDIVKERVEDVLRAYKRDYTSFKDCIDGWTEEPVGGLSLKLIESPVLGNPDKDVYQVTDENGTEEDVRRYTFGTLRTWYSGPKINGNARKR